MDTKWIIQSSLMLAPAIILFAFFIGHAQTYPADWLFHISGSTAGNYPPIAPFLVSQAYQNGLILPFVVLVVLYLPFALLFKITGSWLAPCAYLYASGIPFILMWGGFWGQAVMHILMLINVLVGPPIWGFMAILGFGTHREWLAATLLSAGIWFIKRRWFNEMDS